MVYASPQCSTRPSTKLFGDCYGRSIAQNPNLGIFLLLRPRDFGFPQIIEALVVRLMLCVVGFICLSAQMLSKSSWYLDFSFKLEATKSTITKLGHRCTDVLYMELSCFCVVVNEMQTTLQFMLMGTCKSTDLTV